MAGALERGPRVRGGRRSIEAEILRARNAAVSLRHAAHGAHAQLHHRRRGGAIPAHAGISCDPSDGMGRVRAAGGKCGDPARAFIRASGRNTNIESFKRVLQRFGFSYDWRREISTCEPEYYRWNQWFFLRMLERGIAYRKRSRVNWCPKCATVLANEQVVNGCCWRHEDTPVEAERYRAVVSADHAVRRRAARIARSTRRRLARARADHAAQLDREIARHAGAICRRGISGHIDRSVHDARRHDLRRVGADPCAGASAAGDADRGRRRTTRRLRRSCRGCGGGRRARPTLPRRKKRDSSPGGTRSIRSTAKRFRSGWEILC